MNRRIKRNSRKAKTENQKFEEKQLILQKTKSRYGIKMDMKMAM